MNIKPLLVTLIVSVLQTASIYAIDSLQGAFVAHYPDTKGTALENCATCHMPMDADLLNPYGRAYRDAAKDFAAIEALDSDLDGMNNLDEIKALRNPGSQALTPELFTFTNKMGNVQFNHAIHVTGESYLSKGNCSNCHVSDGTKFAKKFDDTISALKIAHKVCLDCHKASGSTVAPTACDGCHKKPT
ncbi:MAG: cytochrome c3 family protein [Deltaproteobacteria bacterium]|nr:cytochrome c3 family protein [Deltaproteobacteria bacterium]